MPKIIQMEAKKQDGIKFLNTKSSHSSKMSFFIHFYVYRYVLYRYNTY